VFPVPLSLQRLADQADGWLELRLPERALELLAPLLDDAAGRPAGLMLRIRANVRLGELAAALPDLAELRRVDPTEDWVDLTEAWCRKRTGDLTGAIACLERVVVRDPRSDIAHFNLGCYLAIAGERDRAIDEVTLACGLNDECRDFARDDPDLDGLRTDPRFRQLLREERSPTAAAAAGANGGGDDDDEDDDDDDDELGGEPGGGNDDDDRPRGDGRGRRPDIGRN
jgi:tetratricopeptide (TPR) repeat protein